MEEGWDKAPEQIHKELYKWFMKFPIKWLTKLHQKDQILNTVGKLTDEFGQTRHLRTRAFRRNTILQMKHEMTCFGNQPKKRNLFNFLTIYVFREPTPPLRC